MKTKRLIAAVLILILCIGGYLAVKSLDLSETGEEEPAAEYVFQAEEITGFSFESGGETLTFTKEEDTWVYGDNRALSMKQTQLTSMESCLKEVEALKTLEEPEALSEYGLEEPSNRITIVTPEAATVLLLGNENPAAGGYYAMVEGESIVYLIPDTIPDKFSLSLDDLKETEAETSAEETSQEESQ